MKINKKAVWSVVALLIAVLTIRVVFAGSGMTLQQLREGIKSASLAWMLPALCCMFGIIYFEGEALLVIVRSAGYHCSRKSGFLYSAADAYFSAITPSATGGQPGSAYFMIRDGISGPVTAAALLLNVMMYTAVLALYGVICILIRPNAFFRLSSGSRILVTAGFAVILLQVAVFWFALKKPAFLSKISNMLISLLHRLRLMKHPEKWVEKVRHMLEEYDSCVRILSGHRRMLWIAFLLNMLQRASQFSCVVFVYMALGGKIGNAADLWVLQCLIYIGVYCVPIPGSMGVTDALMLDGYMKLMARNMAFQVQILTRGLTFYCCIIISGITVIIGYMVLRRRHKKLKTG